MSEMDWHWNWPFPRIRFWIKTGIWCEHPCWSRWLMIEAGMTQIRWCDNCGKTQIR